MATPFRGYLRAGIFADQVAGLHPQFSLTDITVKSTMNNTTLHRLVVPSSRMYTRRTPTKQRGHVVENIHRLLCHHLAQRDTFPVARRWHRRRWWRVRTLTTGLTDIIFGIVNILYAFNSMESARKSIVKDTRRYVKNIQRKNYLERSWVRVVIRTRHI